ncbi:MAG: beta-glucanase [Lentisphaerae bacterium]|nr:MAG: beta-glucanase [Lentisphaerota bacterium]
MGCVHASPTPCNYLPMFNEDESATKMKPDLLQMMISFLFLWNMAQAGPPLKPFPQADMLDYHGIRPGNHSQNELNAAAIKFYEYWKKKYLIESSKVPGDYKVDYNKHGTTVSEAMGYGMLITVQMAGYDPKAKMYFDGLNRFRKRYPSKINKAFMNWKVNEERPRQDDSATDGDVDMATALLMAAEQWGDRAYLEEAKIIIKNIGTHLVRKDYSLRLGDWNSDGGTHEGTRPSDFATAHFRCFYVVTRDKRWQKVEEKCYAILEQLQKKYAPKTGLVPDFAVFDSNGTWKPAPPMFLESKNDGQYSYNACRVPWRIGLSALYHNELRAKKILMRLMDWVIKTHPDPETFKAGYDLEGKALVQYDEPVFTSPLAVAAMATGHQKWLDAAFDYVKDYKTDYFSDSVNMLCLLILTGNYWLPACE